MTVGATDIRLKDFGRGGMRIACREGTVDEQAIQPWIEWLELPAPRPQEPAQDDVILDVGAHIGGFTLLAASLAPNGRILAVEACRDSYEMLRRNVELNNLENVEASHLALAGRPGEVRLHRGATGNWGNSITSASGPVVERVPATTLAAYLDERAVDRCDFAKLNCEGAEFQILLSSPPETLRRIARMLVFHHLELVDDQNSLAELERHLERAGFELGLRGGGAAHGHFTADLTT